MSDTTTTSTTTNNDYLSDSDAIVTDVVTNNDDAAAAAAADELLRQAAPTSAAASNHQQTPPTMDDTTTTTPTMSASSISSQSSHTTASTTTMPAIGATTAMKSPPTGTHFLVAVHNLLDGIADKEDDVRRSVETALQRTVDKRPNEALMAICEYRVARPKMADAQVALLMRVIEQFCHEQSARLHIDPLNRLIAFTIAEITKSPVHNDTVQRPGVETLVAIGRLHCDTIMDAMCAHLQPQTGVSVGSSQAGAAHFMVLHTMGALAMANTAGFVRHLKPTLVAVLPTLAQIRTDHVRQVYATALGRFAEAIAEYSADNDATNGGSGPPQQPPPDGNEAASLLVFESEMAIAYDVLINQWLPCRDAKISGDILQALAHIYGLLPPALITEQAGKTVQQLLAFYRRSMDRNAITQLLAAVVKATLEHDAAALDAFFDALCVHLFDLVCVHPDYERPQTVKGHYEVLRCFDRLHCVHADRVADMLLVQLRSNNERERIKSLLVLTHLCNSGSGSENTGNGSGSSSTAKVRARLAEYTALLWPMLHAERTHKMKMVLLKLVLAFAQNGLLQPDGGECVRFLLRNCSDMPTAATATGSSNANVNSPALAGAQADLAELQQTSRNALYIMVTSVPHLDGLVKAELLRAFVHIEHTPATGTIAKCLAKLFARNAEIAEPKDAGAATAADASPLSPTAALPRAASATEEINATNPETIFVRCLCLLGNPREVQRSEHILQFLKHFCPALNKHLRQLWLERIPELLADLETGQTAQFEEHLFAFVHATIRDVDDFKFAEFLVIKLVQQQPLYTQHPLHTPISGAAPAEPPPNAALPAEWVAQHLQREHGQLLKLIGLCVGYVTDAPMVDAMIDLILNGARMERAQKNTPIAYWLSRFADSTTALGFVARFHLAEVLKAVSVTLVPEASRKTGTNFFSNLNFLKDSAKEADMARNQLLAIEAYRNIAQMAPAADLLPDVDATMVAYLCRQLPDAKDPIITHSVLVTLRTIATAALRQPAGGDTPAHRLASTDKLLQLLVRLDVDGERLSLFPLILKLATVLLQLQHRNEDIGGDARRAAGAASDGGAGSAAAASSVASIDPAPLSMYGVFEKFACRFFHTAEQLRTKFDTVDADRRNSFLAMHLNESLPELNQLVKVVLERAASPLALDECTAVLDHWLRSANSEVRICAGHMLNHALGVFMRTVRIGGEAPAKFNECGTMLAFIVPRCMDVNATVRQTAVDMLRQVLEIACVYETLTIADESMEWVQELQRMHEDILTDNSKDMYRITGDMARIIAQRLSHFQYFQFCKSLLCTLNDVEQSSAIGSSLVLRSFVQIKGGEMFHVIPDLVTEALHALQSCSCSPARSGVLKALIALAKHHPIAVCNAMLAQPLPFDQNVRDFWTTLATIDASLCGTVLDNFLATLSTSCLYESPSESPLRRLSATAQPFAIQCTLHEMLGVPEIRAELLARFPDLFAMLLVSVATYTNLAPPAQTPSKPAGGSQTNAVPPSRSMFSFGSSSSSNSTGSNANNAASGTSAAGTAGWQAAAVPMPCHIVLGSFRALLGNLGMEQLDAVLAICPQLAEASDLMRFVELLAPMAVGLVRELGADSRQLSRTVQALSRSVSSPYEPQRVAAVGLYAQLVPLRPVNELAVVANNGAANHGSTSASDVTAIIMLHLNSGLTDPNALVRGLCIRGLAQVAGLGAADVTKYAEISLAALLKGVDDANADCLINVPLESMLGLSRLLNALPRERLANFQVSLAIRLRPFFENAVVEIREAAILLFGDLCRAKLEHTVDSMMQKVNHHQTSAAAPAPNDEDDDGAEVGEYIAQALREQLLANFVTILLHLSETEARIVHASKVTLRRVCTLLNAPNVNGMVQKQLQDHMTVNFDVFVVALLKLVGTELNGSIPDFIESTLPYLKSNWPQLRGNAAIVIGILHNLYGPGHATEAVSQRLVNLMRDDQAAVRTKAAQGLGYMFGEW